MSTNKYYDVIIIGGGAAGLMCAKISGQRGRKTLLVEHNENVGDKIRISGGGRCNFTNLNVTQHNYISNNSRFCISALKTFTNHDFIKLIENNNISYHEKTLGQLFCDNSAKEIIYLLKNDCEKNAVTIKTNHSVFDIKKHDDKFLLNINNEIYECFSLVIATGALSIPKMGATDFGYKIAKKFSHNIITPKPALVPLTLSERQLEKTKELSGISIDSIVSFKKNKFRENILFTHKGLSGPAILQISSYWQNGEEIIINLAPDLNVFNFLKQEKQKFPKQNLDNILAKFLPKKLVNLLYHNPSNIGEISDKQLYLTANNINSWSIKPSGTEGFAKAEVTLGGVDTDEISSKTFMSKKVENLYFIGEVLDVTGHLGGYNFQWAWSSGYCAGLTV